MRAIKTVGILMLFTSLGVLGGCTSTSTTSNSANVESIDTGANFSAAADKRLALGLAYLRQGNFERAKYNLDKALQYRPKRASVQIGLAYYFQSVKEYRQARKHYKMAMEIAPDNADNMNTFGSFLCSRGEFKQANRLFMRVVKIPEYANIAATYENAGLCAGRQGDFTRAEGYFRKALNHNPEMAKSLLEMAKIEYSRGKMMKARAFLERHLAVARVSPQALWLGIRVEHVLGGKDALASYRLKLARMFPQSAEAKKLLRQTKMKKSGSS